MIGMAMFGLASLLSSYAQTPDQLIWARAAMGLGGAAVMPQTLSIITNVFEPHERRAGHRDLGRGGRHGHRDRPDRRRPAARPLLVGLGLPDQRAGHRGRASPRSDPVVPESKSPTPGRIDYLGVLLSIAGLVLVVYGIIEGGDTGSWLTGDVLGPVVGGPGGARGRSPGTRRESEHPTLDVRLFRDPRLSSAAAAIALVFFALAGAYFFTSFYLQNVRGYSPLHAGLLTIPLAAGQLLLLAAQRRAGPAVRRQGRGHGRAAGRGGVRAGGLPPAGHDHADLGAGGRPSSSRARPWARSCRWPPRG